MAHKQTNKMTSIIYALTLGCVIFLCVSLNLLIKSATSIGGIDGSDLYQTDTGYSNSLNATKVDPILEQYAGDIKEFAWMTYNSQQQVYTQNKTNGVYLSARQADTGRQTTVVAFNIGLSPSPYFDEYIDTEWQSANTGLGLSE